MKIVVNALVESVNAIFSVSIVIFLVWLMFGIIGVSLFANKLGYCDTDDYYGINKTACQNLGKTWSNQPWNFDNILDGITTLFVISSLEGWPNIMFAFIDGADEDIGPNKDANLMACWYFIGFVMLGSFF